MKEKRILQGIIVVLIGAAIMVVSRLMGGTGVKDFIAGVLLGVSIGDMLVGVYLIGRGVAKK